MTTDNNPKEIYTEYKQSVIDRNFTIESITLLVETDKGVHFRAEIVEDLGN